MTGKRNRPSTVDRLLPSLQDLIADLHRKGFTIDEIRAKLLELDVDVSRSALGRHTKSLAQIAVDMRRARELSLAVVGEFGEETDDRAGRATVELMNAHFMRLLTAVQVDEETGEAGLVQLSSKELMELGRSISSIASAAKSVDDRIEKAEKRAAAKATSEAAEKAVTAARAQGLSVDGVKAIRFAVLGA